jgi:2-methylisocitrate lyase-like PEP mutase family enzyme
MEKKIKFRDLVSKEQIFAPCVYDCISARAAEECGYQALMLSGGAVAYSMDGLPDMGFVSIDELIWITERMTNFSPLPVIVDADDGYGESPIVVYRNMYRLAKAGAMGITVDDSTGIRGFERMLAPGKKKPRWQDTVIPRDAWLSKIKASLAACEGSDCVVIARVGIPLDSEEGFVESMERAIRARDLGAEMTMVGVRTLEDAKRVAKYDIGWKMWPDVFSIDGVPTVKLEDIYPLGFNFVTMHIFEKAALYGMLKYGVENMKNQSTVFSELHDMGGYPTLQEQTVVMCNYRKWLDMEVEFKKLPW